MNITPGQQNQLNFDCSLSASVLNYLHGRKINWFDFSEVLNNGCSDFSTILKTFFMGSCQCESEDISTGNNLTDHV